MPYTPPSQRSPASSNGSSPILSRSHSYSNELGVSAPISSSKPALRRSHSSAAYLQRHRRAPSISQVNGLSSPTVAGQSRPERPSTSDGVVRTPPDSPQGSDDDERARKLGRLKELHVALSSIHQKRDPSPTGEDPSAEVVPSARPALTAEARKISHSRSSSEIMLSKHAQAADHSSAIRGSDDSSEDEPSLQIKRPLLRKKSGELVKPALRPVSRRRPSSMPGTPTYSKAVHFNDDIEQVRHFLQVDRPIAVSAGSSPVETYDSESEYPFGYSVSPRRVEWELRLANFPRDSYERQSKPVRVERIFLSTDSQTLIGSVAVANLAYQKTVVARFTLDYWKTVSEITAEYTNDVRKKPAHDGCDRFNFTIKLNDQVNLEKKTLLLCVRYSVAGQEYWDNNENMNYQVDFIKKTKPKAVQPMAKPGLHPHSHSLGAIPRSRHTRPAPRPRSMPPSIDDDFGTGVGSDFRFGSSPGDLGESPNATTIKLKKKPTPGNTFTGAAYPRHGAAQAFSTRYDFGASLSAALSSAQNVLGDRSGRLPMRSSGPSASPEEPRKSSSTISKEKPARSSSTAPTTVPGTRPDALSSGKPDLQSAEYNELIQKYCFFGSSGKAVSASRSTSTSLVGTRPSPSAVPSAQSQTDGLGNGPASESRAGSSGAEATETGSPAAPGDLSTSLDGTNERSGSPSSARAFVSTGSSAGPVTGGSLRSTRGGSPYRYPYQQNRHGSFFNDAGTPTAIRG